MDVIFHFSTLLALFTVVINTGLAEGECMHSCIEDQTCNHKKVGHSCYYVFKNITMTWNNSRLFCKNHHLSMVKLTEEMLSSKHEVMKFFPDIPHPNNGIWLGGKAKDFDTWQFLNGELAHFYEGVFSRTINGTSWAKCGMMYLESVPDPGIWEFREFNTSNCHSKKYFVCQFDQDGSYFIVGEKKTWFEAREHCLDLDGDLFYPDTSELQNLPFPFEGEVSSKNLYVHIGLRHRRWEWIDGKEILYTNWDNNQPDLLYERCLMMYGDTGKWNDDWCGSEKVIACQGVISDSETRGPTELPSPDSNMAPTQAMHTNKAHPSGFLVTGSSDSTAPPIESENSASKSKVDIIVGASLGIFFIIASALAVFFLCRHFTKDKPASPTSADNDANHYEVPVMNDYENDIMANATKFESHFNEKNSAGPALAGNDAEHYEVCVRHEYENDNIANATNFESDFSEEKPVISASACNDTDHYEVPVRHEYVNDNMANASSYERLAAPS